MNNIALLMTLLMGIFIPLGGLIGYYLKNSTKILHLLMSIAVGVIIPLITLEIMPEVLEIFADEFTNETAPIYAIVFFLLGVLILKILDMFIPDHSHKCEDDSCKKEYFHIGVMSFVALFLHDFIEGMAVYAGAATSISLGISLIIGVGFHNIPLGALISSTIKNSTSSIKKTLVFIGILFLTPFMGGLLVYFNSDFFLSELVLSSLLAITSGMLAYIVIFELMPEVLENKKNIFGVLIGISIMVISMLI